ncbi:hypothetical protein [Pseudomonas fluorescens]|nr:hypothetical protein [Pseudomonas fluorescens]
MGVNDYADGLNERAVLAFSRAGSLPQKTPTVLPRAPAAASQRLLYFLK